MQCVGNIAYRDSSCHPLVGINIQLTRPGANCVGDGAMISPPLVGLQSQPTCRLVSGVDLPFGSPQAGSLVGFVLA